MAQNLRVIVTGGASGIGLEIVKLLISNGAKQVAILDIDCELGKEACDTINKENGGNRVIFLQCDVTKNDEQSGAFKKVFETFGGLDLIINNAGIIDNINWERTIQVNMIGVARGTVLGLELMGNHKGGKGGTIINIASTGGFMNNPVLPIYIGTQAGNIAMTRCFGDSMNLKRYGVRVISLCPGVTDTSLFKEKIMKNVEKENLGFVDEMKKAFPLQSPVSVAESLINIIKVGESGHVYVSEEDKPFYKLSIPEYQSMK